MKVAVIGAGAAGRQFALDCAAAGHQVTLEDVMPEKLRRAETELAALHLSALPIRLVSTVEDAVRGQDGPTGIAVDFVPDDLESKLEILSLLDRMAPPQTILLTPSQMLSVTDLASCTYRPERTLMMREAGSDTLLLVTRRTEAQAQETAMELLRSLGRSTAVLQDPDLPQLMKNMGVSSFE